MDLLKTTEKVKNKTIIGLKSLLPTSAVEVADKLKIRL